MFYSYLHVVQGLTFCDILLDGVDDIAGMILGYSLSDQMVNR